MPDIEAMAIDYRDPAAELIAVEEAASAMPLPGDGYFDWASIKAIGDFAAANPQRWRTIAAKMDDPGASQAELARRLGINQATVARHLQRLKIAPGRE